MSKRLQDSFVLGAYLIKPFQRMARYQLFLKDFVKHSVKSDLAGKFKEYYDKLKVCVLCVAVFVVWEFVSINKVFANKFISFLDWCAFTVHSVGIQEALAVF